MTRLRSVNPASEEVMREFGADPPTIVDRKLARALAAFEIHRRGAFARRSECLQNAAAILTQDVEPLSALLTSEMGKTRKSAREEVLKCALGCSYYAEHGERLLSPENYPVAEVHFQPIGPVLAVMPWNFPFWQVFRFAAPALMAGNTALLKHASNVPQCALALEDIFQRAGFENGVFQTLLIGSGDVASVIADPRVRAVSLTGSVEAGRQVASLAGKHVKKTVLELGGSDPFIVMPSADRQKAVEVAVQARIVNNGQSCIAAKRFLVQEAIYDDFAAMFVETMASLRVGDPMSDDTQVGPLATTGVVSSVDDQVKRSVASGAAVLTGGGRPNGWGFYFEPTVLANVPDGSPAACEELFGPVASLFKVRDIDEAIARANETPFGLGASVWTNDAREKQRFRDEIEAGMVFYNAMVASDPRVPFGGVKDSGYGRELGGAGIREFTNWQTVWLGEPSTHSVE